MEEEEKEKEQLISIDSSKTFGRVRAERSGANLISRSLSVSPVLSSLIITA